MNTEQKGSIKKLREQGVSYKKVAELLSISENTVKSYCKRNGLAGFLGAKRVNVSDIRFCKYCGTPIKKNHRGETKKFCCQDHRLKWWAEHPEMKQRFAMYEYVCPYCKKTFKAYGNSHRKYCSHECYINDRFGRASND